MPSNRLNEIERAAAISQLLEPSPLEIDQWQNSTNQLVSDFFRSLPTRSTFQPLQQDQIAQFESDCARSVNLPSLLRTVMESMTGSGLLASGSGHMAFVPGGGLYIGAVADHLASSINAFTADSFAAPIAVKIHEEVIQSLCSMIGYNDKAWGDITSGGSQATLTAFWTARESHSIRAKDYERTVAYLSEQTHHCCEKALRILFGDDLIIRNIPLTEYRIDAENLTAIIAQDRESGLNPFLVVATAGTTNLGRIDPLDAIAAIAEREELWFHVDAAYGGFFMLCEELKHKFAGISRADSVVLDPHKSLFLPYGCGTVLIKNGDLLRQDKDQEGAYLQDRENSKLKSPMDYSLELTRPFRSLRIWLALKHYGPEVLASALREKYLLAQHCREEFEKIPNIKMVTDLDLSIFAFSIDADGGYEEDRLNRRLLKAINQHPEIFLSSTLLDDVYVLRVAILSFRTHLVTVERLIEVVREETRKLLATL